MEMPVQVKTCAKCTVPHFIPRFRMYFVHDSNMFRYFFTGLWIYFILILDLEDVYSKFSRFQWYYS